MNNEIDKKIIQSIEEQSGYSFTVFRTRFNDGARDAVMVFKDVHNIYGRYMTADYCAMMLKLLRYRVDDALSHQA